jgi:hypothetical protein
VYIMNNVIDGREWKTLTGSHVVFGKPTNWLDVHWIPASTCGICVLCKRNRHIACYLCVMYVAANRGKKCHGQDRVPSEQVHDYS